MVGLDRVDKELVELLLVRVDLHRLIACPAEPVDAIVVEEEAVGGLVVIAVIGFDRIGEATDAAGDGKGAITLGDHLSDAAWLKERGHQEEVGTRVDVVSELVGVAAVNRDAGWITGMERFEAFLEVALA